MKTKKDRTHIQLDVDVKERLEKVRDTKKLGSLSNAVWHLMEKVEELERERCKEK